MSGGAISTDSVHETTTQPAADRAHHLELAVGQPGQARCSWAHRYLRERAGIDSLASTNAGRPTCSRIAHGPKRPEQAGDARVVLRQIPSADESGRVSVEGSWRWRGRDGTYVSSYPSIRIPWVPWLAPKRVSPADHGWPPDTVPWG